MKAKEAQVSDSRKKVSSDRRASAEGLPDPARRRQLRQGLGIAALPWLGGSTLALTACSPTDPRALRLQHARGAEPLVIGLAWPLQHPKRTLRNGVEMALEEINAAGGVLGRSLRLAVADDERSVETGMVIAERFAQNPALIAVLGHLDTYVATQVAPSYMVNEVVLLSPGAMGLDLTRKGHDKVFRTYPSEAVVATALANHATAVGYTKVAVYYSNDSSGHDLVQGFEQQARDRGVTIVDRRPYNLLGTDHRQVFEEWRAMHRFDAIFLAATLPSGVEIIQQMRQAGLRQPILGNTGLDGNELVTLGGEAVEGVVVPTVFQVEMPSAAAQTFTARYTERFGAKPGASAAIGYDTTRVLAEAIRHAQSAEPDRIAAALRDMPPWTGVTGPFAFDGQGELKPRAMVLKGVRGGRWTYLGEIDDDKRCRMVPASDGFVRRCTDGNS